MTLEQSNANGEPAALSADRTDNLLSGLATRLVTLHDGQRGLRETLPVKVAPSPMREPAASAGPASDAVIDFIASDATLDRAGEIISAAGWRLDRYRRNPVFQNAHNYGNIIHTLGRAVIAEVRDDRLFLRVLFAVEINPLARLACQLYRTGFLHAVSVGFLPLRWEDGGAGAPWRRKYVEQELLEVSAVAVPANHNALALALKSGAVDAAALPGVHEWLSGALAPYPPSAAPEQAGWLAVLEQARHISQFLRRWAGQ